MNILDELLNTVAEFYTIPEKLRTSLFQLVNDKIYYYDSDAGVLARIDNSGYLELPELESAESHGFYTFNQLSLFIKQTIISLAYDGK